jgi:transcription elongation factor GreA
MADKTYPMTKEGLLDLEAKLEDLKLVKRPQVVERLQIARSYGDLSENSEYDAARDEQAHLEGEIQRIEYMIKNAEIVDASTVNRNEVSIGKKVTVEYSDGEQDEIEIVGVAAVDIMENKFSNESPIGQALIGKKKGDVVSYEAPAGPVELKILKVGKA